MSTKPTKVKLDLEFPFEHEGQTFNSLTFRRMRAGDTLVAEGEEREAMAGCLIFAALADVDVEVILMLDMEDFEKVSEVVAPLMGKSAHAAVAAAAAATKAA